MVTESLGSAEEGADKDDDGAGEMRDLEFVLIYNVQELEKNFAENIVSGAHLSENEQSSTWVISCGGVDKPYSVYFVSLLLNSVFSKMLADNIKTHRGRLNI